MDSLNTFGLSRNGHGLVCRFLSSGAAGQPYDAIPVGFDMNALQVICSAASLVLISVVMAESFTKTNACEVSEVESSAAMATADPSNAPQATQFIANRVFMVFPYC